MSTSSAEVDFAGWNNRPMSGAVAVGLWVLLGLGYLAFYLSFRRKEIRAAWAQRAEGEGAHWKVLIPRPERPWMPWATIGVFGPLAAINYAEGILWLAVPATVLCLIALAQLATPPSDSN